MNFYSLPDLLLVSEDEVKTALTHIDKPSSDKEEDGVDEVVPGGTLRGPTKTK